MDRRSRLGTAAARGAAASEMAAQVSGEGARARRGDGARGHGEATRGHGKTTRSAAARAWRALHQGSSGQRYRASVRISFTERRR